MRLARSSGAGRSFSPSRVSTASVDLDVLGQHRPKIG
jgi:hypothetical protein